MLMKSKKILRVSFVSVVSYLFVVGDAFAANSEPNPIIEHPIIALLLYPIIFILFWKFYPSYVSSLRKASMSNFQFFFERLGISFVNSLLIGTFGMMFLFGG